MSVKSALRKMQRAFAAKDANAFDDAMEELEDKVGDENQPDTIEVHNHIPGNDGIGELPPTDPTTTGARDDEQPEWFKNFSNDCMDKFNSIDDKFEAMGNARDFDPDDPDNTGTQIPPKKTAKEGDDMGNLEMDSRDAKDDEANKKILGELEFEAPPGTGDKATRAKDSMYLKESFQDVASKAEILAPGIRLPTFDRAASPVKTAKALFGLRRTALDLAYGQPETRGIIDAALSGHTFDSKKMAYGAVRVLFNTVAAQTARDNTARSTADRRTVRPANGGGHSVGGKLTTLASINERNKEKFGRKSA